MIAGPRGSTDRRRACWRRAALLAALVGRLPLADGGADACPLLAAACSCASDGVTRSPMVAAAAAGVLVWAVPLHRPERRPRGATCAALGSQAGEDFAGVVMLWTHPDAAGGACGGAVNTFVRPWDSPLLGGVMLVARGRRRCWSWRGATPRCSRCSASTFGPYALFHLLFQETVDDPLRAAADSARSRISPRRRRWRGCPDGLATRRRSAVARPAVRRVPASSAFGREPSPFFALLRRDAACAARGAQPLVGMHRRVFTESRRARVYAGELPARSLPTPRDYEWLELTRAWREGLRRRDVVRRRSAADRPCADRSGARAVCASTAGRSTSAVYVGGTQA